MELVSKPDHDHMVFSRLSQEQSLVELKVLEYNTQTNHKPLISAEPQQIGEALRGFSELILRTQSTEVFFTALHTDNGHAKHKTKVERNAPDRGGVYCPSDC